MSRQFIAALDEGTSSARFAIYDEQRRMIVHHQIPIQSLYPQEGWVEQDPQVILEIVLECIHEGVQKFLALGHQITEIKGLGITNQRETTIIWDKTTGRPLHNAIVWSDSRTKEMTDQMKASTDESIVLEMKKKSGLPLHPYFSATKIKWLLENVKVVKEEVANNRCIVGTMDSWLIWNLTGGRNQGKHVTDVTNASRTMLMDLKTLDWDQKICDFFGIPIGILPLIRSSSEIYGIVVEGPLQGVPVSGCLGDQQAALVGQNCLTKGSAKNTYGTGCFLLYNTGTHIVNSKHGLLTTVAFKFGEKGQVHYALEGAINVAGSAVRWLRDNLQIINNSDDVQQLAESVHDNGGVYFVPAFSGLFAPHWDTAARGLLIGLTEGSDKRHIARATLESVCFQTKEVLEAMIEDCRYNPQYLSVDGGMVRNYLVLQIQADMLGITVVRPRDLETTCLGAAIAAGMAQGVDVYRQNTKDKQYHQQHDDDVITFTPRTSTEGRDEQYAMWKKAVSKSRDWLSHPQYHHAPKAKSGGRGKWVLASGIVVAVGLAAYFYGDKFTARFSARFR